jgi:hypothetical protein
MPLWKENYRTKSFLFAVALGTIGDMLGSGLSVEFPPAAWTLNSLIYFFQCGRKWLSILSCLFPIEGVSKPVAFYLPLRNALRLLLGLLLPLELQGLIVDHLSVEDFALDFALAAQPNVLLQCPFVELLPTALWTLNQHHFLELSQLLDLCLRCFRGYNNFISHFLKGFDGLFGWSLLDCLPRFCLLRWQLALVGSLRRFGHFNGFFLVSDFLLGDAVVICALEWSFIAVRSGRRWMPDYSSGLLNILSRRLIPPGVGVGIGRARRFGIVGQLQFARADKVVVVALVVGLDLLLLDLLHELQVEGVHSNYKA